MIARRLGPIHDLGPLRLAAVEETRITAAACPGRVTGSAQKRARAIVMAGPDGVRAVYPDGRPMPRAVLQKLCPEALLAFGVTPDQSRTLNPEEET